MKIKDIYEALRDTGLTQSQVQFSRNWLGRSPRYYSHLVAKEREPGLPVFCGIVWRLERFLANSTKPWPHLVQLKLALNQHVERRTITDVCRSGRKRKSGV